MKKIDERKVEGPGFFLTYDHLCRCWYVAASNMEFSVSNREAMDGGLASACRRLLPPPLGDLVARAYHWMSDTLYYASKREALDAALTLGEFRRSVPASIQVPWSALPIGAELN